MGSVAAGTSLVFVLEVDRQRLSKAPRIDDNWPTVAAVDAAWGVEWQAAKTVLPERVTPNDTDDQEDVDRHFGGMIER